MILNAQDSEASHNYFEALLPLELKKPSFECKRVNFCERTSTFKYRRVVQIPLPPSSSFSTFV